MSRIQQSAIRRSPDRGRLAAVVTAGLLLGILGCQAAGASSEADDQTPAQGPAGCWRIEVAEQADSAVVRGLPAAVRLEATPLEGYTIPDQQAYTAWSLNDGEPTDHPFRAWYRIPPDSVWVGHPAAYAGHVLRLALAADTLTGTLHSFTDVMPAESMVRPVRLVRIPCRDDAGERRGL
ncbi:MAG: hypothetical protein ACN0LA_10585 [Candidatus Longimicrobiales bacterium M2_2A_002]